MKILKHLPAVVVKLKKDRGNLPDAATIRFIFDLDKIARRFELKGREDGVHGKSALGDEAFTSWVKKSFCDDRAFDDLVRLIKKAYMDGYREGRVKYGK